MDWKITLVYKCNNIHGEKDGETLTSCAIYEAFFYLSPFFVRGARKRSVTLIIKATLPAPLLGPPAAAANLRLIIIFILAVTIVIILVLLLMKTCEL